MLWRDKMTELIDSGKFLRAIIIINIIFNFGIPAASAATECEREKIDNLIAQIKPENVVTPEDLTIAIDATRELINYADVDGVIDALILALDRGSTFNSFTLMCCASTALSQIGEPAVPHLMAQLDNDRLQEGVIRAFRGMDVNYPEVTAIAIELLNDERPDVISTCMGYLMKWGTGGVDLSREISALITNDDHHVRTTACDAASTLGYRQDYVFDALLTYFTEWEDDELRSYASINMARLAPTPDYVDEQILTMFHNLEDEQEIIHFTSILFINDNSRYQMLNILAGYLKQPGNSRAVTSQALYALIIIGEPAAPILDDLKRLQENPLWAGNEALLYLIDLYENVE